jgi:predicted transcriptional regulator
MSEQKLFSINGAADLLERDRATISRAVRAVPADGHDKAGHPKWKMATIVQAMSQNSGASPRMIELADELEATGAEAMEVLQRLRDLPTITKRREYAQSGACKAIGRLHEALEACKQSLKPTERDVWMIAADVAVGQAVAEVVQLCDFQFKPEDLTQ